MSIVLNPVVEPAVNATVTVANLPVEVTFPSTQEISITGPDDTITPVDDNGTYVALATAAGQTTGNASLSSIDTKLTSPITVTGLLTDAQLRASRVPVDGSGVVQPVSGPLTDAQLRATPVPISGTVTANTGLSQPLTDAQLRATPVPISGTVTSTPGGTQDVNIVSSTTLPVNTGLSQPLTDTQLRASAVPVDGSGVIQPVSGTVTANLGTIGGAATAANQATEIASLASIDSKLTSPITITGALTDTQLRATPVPVSGTVTANAGVNLNTSLLALDSTVAKDASLTTLNTSVNTLLKPANTLAAVTTVGTVSTITNVVHVDDNSGSLTVDNGGTFAVQATIGAGSAVIGHVIADSGSTTAVTGNVASTVADGANVTLGAKADAKSTATDTTAISAMSVLKQISASVQAPPSQAVTNAGTFAVQAAATLAAETTKVIGTVNQGTSPWVISGTVTTGAASGTLTDRSGTATNTSSVLMAANASRKYLFIQSLGKGIWINFTSAATALSPSIFIPANSTFNMSQFVSTEAINVIRDSSPNQPFTAKEG